MSVKEKKPMHRLGRGLENVFGRSFVGGGRSIIEIPIENIKANTYQPRQQFDTEALNILANSIKQNGLAQPILVRPLEGSDYELIAGERRLRACKLAGFKAIRSTRTTRYRVCEPAYLVNSSTSTMLEHCASGVLS